MHSNDLRTLTKCIKGLALAGLIAASFGIGSAQVRPANPTSAADSNEPNGYASIEEEMRAKREIQAADKAHKENQTRARNLAFLGALVLSEFKEKSCLDRDAIKNLEKAEKLAKSIRDAAGGSEDKVEMEKRPADLSTALTMLSELADSLKDKVEKTPKRVVSAAVIDEANVLLELIRIVRAMQPKA